MQFQVGDAVRTVETPVSEDGRFVRHDYLIPAEWIDIGLGCALAALGAVPGDRRWP